MEESLLKKIEKLEERIEEIESEFPDTMLLDHSFFKRAFTVFGHNLAANTIIAIPFFMLFQYFLGRMMEYTY